MIWFALVVVLLVAIWSLLHFKTSRPDGRLLPVQPYRQLMFQIMPTRTESVVYFDVFVRAEKLERYLEQAGTKFGATMTHATLAASNLCLCAAPRMNRFVLGRRLYERDGRWLTFTMKRTKLDREAKLSTVKMQMHDGETFPALCARINEHIGVERSGKRTHADKEFDLFNLLPRPALRGGVGALMVLDYFNLLPGWYIKDDPLYTSIFVANLGSLGMRAGFHHLFEYGNCPGFVMVGKVEDVACVEDGKVVPGRQLHMRVTYDERIDDGLNARLGMDAMVRVLSDPERWLGGVDTEAKAMWPRSDWE